MFNNLKYCETKTGGQDTFYYFLHILSHFVAVKHGGTFYLGVLACVCEHNPFHSSVEMISQGLQV